MTRARHIRPAQSARCPAPALLPAVLMPALLALAMLVLAMEGRIAMDPRLAGVILLGWGVVPVLAAALAGRGDGSAALGPLAITVALVLPFLPVEVGLVAAGMALFLLAAREQEQPACQALPGGAVALAAHGVILLLAGCLLLLAG